MQRHLTSALAAGAFALAITAPALAQAPHVTAATPEQAGAYLLIVGSCHDCHTPNWVESGGKTSKDSLMTGRALGFKGTWGVDYSKNLRTIVQREDADKWVHTLKTADDGDGALPMPWHNMALMSDEDLRAMWKYIYSLGPAQGERIPRGVKAGKTPTGEYIDLKVITTDTVKKP
jgi:mono/diheme cytochrome c family protein